MVKSFDDILNGARALGPKTIAIAAADEREILEAAVEARRLGIAQPILVGDKVAITAIARANELSIEGMPIVHAPDAKRAAQAAVMLARDGTAEIIMRGRMDIAELMRTALDRVLGLRMGRLLSHLSVFEIPGFDRLLFVTDAGVVIEPTLEQKAQIVQNAIDTVHRLGIPRPLVAVLAALEMVNPKMPSTMDAANLAKMADRGQITGGIVDGPLALDNAISLQSAEVKGIVSPVAGRADILVAPDVESGNVLAKGITYFAHGRMAAVVVGGRVPIAAVSRADPSENKLASIGLAVLLTERG
ncbi:MAG: bifunctional enoyl-CoA hydratase/phosphate acetyltransferase [Chloroflexota bacterium]